ncbi:hypothetical protein Ga0609869_000032 [Rhodovulum iodosum]|uniref:Uncharacterized protein n=1 Tax=Rhodovulum iodosum TaxID=68291 RepID=A0ABV3XNQ6_9RHOB|nr:hypothetical protein [Rhodovulum robiginosum]RSK35822.1 hypothetical protein EJA01_05590 [Rhodovulum robiginosum]
MEKTETGQITIVGNVRASDGTKKVLNELTDKHCEKIKKCEPLTYADTMAKEWKATPQTVDLAVMLAGLIKSGEGEVSIRNFMTTMKARWPALDMPYLKNVRGAANVILDAERRAAAKGGDTNVIDEDDFQALCNYALTTIERDNRWTPKLFKRDGQWVEIQYMGETGTATTVPLDRDTFAARLNLSTFWRKRVGDGTSFRYVSAPKDVVNQIFYHAEKPVPELYGVIYAPVFTAEGDLIITPGYHKSGFYYAPPEGLDVPRPPRKITEEHLAEARETILDIFVNFEMDGVSRAELEEAVLRLLGNKKWGSGEGATAVPPSFLSAVGFLLEQIVRPMINGPVMPLLISKTARRAGGGLLATVMQTVIRGTAGMRPLAGNEEERRKAILAALSSGTSVIAWDNLPTGRTINSPTLATLFTEGLYIDRELKTSVERAIPVRASFMLVGNRPPFSDELMQRLSLLELLPQTAAPEKRTGWKHPDLQAHVEENRGRILGALLVLVKHWLNEGQPKPKHPPVIGRFERYRHVIGGILEAASPNWTSWQSNRDKLAKVAKDDEEDGWTDLFEAWADERGLGLAGKIEVNELAQIAQENETPLDVARVKEGGAFEYNTRSLSRSLSGMQERIFDLGKHGEAKLMQSEKRGKGGYPWYLEKVETRSEPVQSEQVEPTRVGRGRRRRVSKNVLDACKYDGGDKAA